MSMHRQPWYRSPVGRRSRRHLLRIEGLEDRVTPVVIPGSGASVAFDAGPVNVGDQITLTAILTTSDTNENGEKEPLIINSDGPFHATVSTYNVASTFNGRIETGDKGTFTAFIQGGDGDEEASITVTVNGKKHGTLTDQEKKVLTTAALDLSDESLNFGGATLAFGFVAGVGTILTGGTAAIVIGAVGLTGTTGLGAVGLVDSKNSNNLNRLVNDPADPNFQTVAPPDIKQIHLQLKTPGSEQPLVDAFNVLLDNLTEQSALTDAMFTATNRATGALEAGNSTAEATQATAIRQFAARLGTLMGAEVGLRQNVATQLKASGIQTRAITASDARSFESSLLSKGLSAQSKELLQFLNSDAQTIDGIGKALGVLDIDLVAGDSVARLTAPARVASLQAAAKSFRSAAFGHGVAVGADAGGGPTVSVFEPDGTKRFSVAAFDQSFSGGVRVAQGDVTGDGVADVVAVTGVGGAPKIVILDGVDGHVVRTLDAFESTFTGGLSVTVADLDGDGFAEIAVGADQGGGPRVRIFSGKDGSVLADFFAIDDANFRGGVRISFADVNGDGTPDLIAAAGFGGGPRVAIFDGKTLKTSTPAKLTGDFFVFEQSLRNGAFVAAGDLNGDGKADLIAGGGPGGGPRVFALDGKDLVDPTGQKLTQLANFFGGDPNSRQGIRVAVRDLDADGRDDLIVGGGPTTGSRVSSYLAKNIKTDGIPPTFQDFSALDANFAGGVFVG